MAVLLDHLDYRQVDVFGCSLGGGVAFQFAVQHPQRVRRLALLSAGYAQDGFYTEMLPLQAQVGAGMAAFMKDTPMYRSYAAIAPNPAGSPKLLDRMGEWTRRPYDWKADVKKLRQGMPFTNPPMCAWRVFDNEGDTPATFVVHHLFG